MTTKEMVELTELIIKYFPKFFDDFTNFQYGTGIDAGKDFKKIFNKAKRLNKKIKDDNKRNSKPK